MENGMIKNDRLWIFYTVLTAFALYWASNLILWIPWSISENLGIAFMLSLSPILWSYGIYLCFKHFQGGNLVKAAFSISLTMVIVSAASDFVFFGLIRHAFAHLYKPTTFYGYLYLLILPFAVLTLFRKSFQLRKKIERKNLYAHGAIASGCMLMITAIILSRVSFSLFLV